MTKRTWVCNYDYEDEWGRTLLRKARYRYDVPPTSGPDKGRTKTFRMHSRHQPAHVWNTRRMFPDMKDYADGLLYNFPALLASPPTRHVWLTEGEKDADALTAAGHVALSHWQGARNFKAAQAERFRGFAGWVSIVADNDKKGAGCAVARYDLLRGVGIPAKRLRIVAAAVRKRKADAADHLAAGFTVDQFRTVPLAVLRPIAEALPAPTGRYDESEDSPHYVSPAERAALANWRPAVLRKVKT